MRKTLLAILSISSLLMSEKLKYRVYAPIFGKVGEININYTTNDKNYKIKANFKAYGFAKSLSGDRIEYYIGEGRVSKNLYFSNHFIQDLNYKDKKSHLEYLFDYKRKKIKKIRVNWRDGKLENKYTKELSYFTHNDFLNCYHNIVTQLKDKGSGEYTIYIAGMEKYGGRLLIKIPSKESQKREAEDMGVKDVWIFHIVTKKRILKSENGEIIFAVGDDGVAKAIRVVDIPMVSHLDIRLIK